MDNVSVSEDNLIKTDNALATYDNRGFEGADLIDRKELESSITSTIIGDQKVSDQLLDSFVSTKSDQEDLNVHQNILPEKLSSQHFEATLCEQAEINRPNTREDSSEISDEELVEYPKEIKPTAVQQIKFSQTNEDLLCTSPQQQLTSSSSAKTMPTSGSAEYVTCKSNETSNVTSAASYLTANDSTFPSSKTLSVSISDSTLSSDSGTLIEDRENVVEEQEQQDQNYDEILNITPIKKIDEVIGELVKDQEDDDDDSSSTTGEFTHQQTIISNIIKEPYDTEIPKSVILCDNSFSEYFFRNDTIEQHQQESLLKQQKLSDSGKLVTRFSLPEQSDTSIETSLETAIYKGSDQNQSDFSSLESNTDQKNQEQLEELNKEHIRDEKMPSIIATRNLDYWDDNTLDDEMIIHEDVDLQQGSKKSSIDLYTLEEEEESKTEDVLSNKLVISTVTKSADNSSSLMEFERLEKEVDQGESQKVVTHHSSLDSIGSIGSTGVLGTPKIGSNILQSDNTSVNSLNEFERLEKEFLNQEQQLEQQQIRKQLTEIEEGHESDLSQSAETISGYSQVEVRAEREDDSEIELDLDTRLDDYTVSYPTTQQQVAEELEATPVHMPQSTSKNEEYDEEVLKIVSTTENRIIEELPTEQSIVPLVVQEEDDAVKILSLQTNSDTNQLVWAVEQQAKYSLNVLTDSSQKNLLNNNNRLLNSFNKPPSLTTNQNISLPKDKENLDCIKSKNDTKFVINKAKIEVQTLEAVQINLDTIPLFTCDLENLDLENSDCFCAQEIDTELKMTTSTTIRTLNETKDCQTTHTSIKITTTTTTTSTCMDEEELNQLLKEDFKDKNA